MRFWIVLMALLPLLSGAAVRVTENGEAVAAVHAPEELLKSADALAEYVERMTGATLPREAAAGAPVIRLALGTEEPRLATLGAAAYLLHTHDGGLDIVGNSPKAVHDGVHDLLYRLGVRWLQPGERWTVVPNQASLTVPELNVVTEPHFGNRDIWYAYGPGIDPSREVLSADYRRWCEGNRLGGVAPFKSGHTYPNTVGKHAAEFEAHPEYFAMKEDGERLPFDRYQSLCYSNPEVARIFAADKLAELRADKAVNPLAWCVSMDPNDSSVACFCEPCKALGNGSDQVLYLANHVARSLRTEFPDAVVSFYVYASHRLPPEKVKAEPNVYVQVATAFNKTNYTLDELVQRWRETVTAIGIRDYLGVEAWDWGLPGRSRGARFSYVREAIPRFRDWGAVAYNAEMNINWGAQGPATTVAAQLLWDPAADAEALYDDWFRHAYGPAAGSMKRLYEMWEESQELTQHALHLWFRQLGQAMEEAKDAAPDVQARLTDMVVLLHYALLYRDWQDARAAGDREGAYAALKPMLIFTWQTRERGIVHAYALQRRLVNSGDPVLRPLADGWHFKDPEAVWKVAEALSDEALMAIFAQDLEATPPDSRRRHFAGPLTIVEGLDELDEPVQPGGFLRGNSEWLVRVPEGAPLVLDLPMEGVRHVYIVTVTDEAGEDVWEGRRSVQTSERYDYATFTVPIELPAAGDYRFHVTGGEDYRPDFPALWHVALDLSEEAHPMIRFYGPAALYVPAGTERLLVKTDGRLSLQAPGWPGRRDFTVADEDAELRCIVIPVEGAEAQVWLINPATSAKCYFLNVPSLLGRPGHPLLVPAGALSHER